MKSIIYKCIGICLLWGCAAAVLHAGEYYGFRVYLKDKEYSPYTVEEPEKYLSAAAIERRVVREKPVTLADLPVSEAYVDSLVAVGTRPVVASKWMNTVVVMAEDSLVAGRLSRLAMVDSVKWVWKGEPAERLVDTAGYTSRMEPVDTPLKAHYGYADKQVKMLNGARLHQAGFRGEGMTVAVIDAGFMNADKISFFDSLKVVGTHNVVFPGQSVYDDDDHGTKVLSCLAANLPGLMVGTAPDASYVLIKSEDGRTEFPVEEDYWVAAAEYADSLGVDVITTSLGYFTFDKDELNYTQDDLDGQTAFISRAAAQVAEKGILLFCSAGNEGAGWWEKITFPADVETLLTIGSVTEKKERSSFSSIGFTADYRVKPDVVALGTDCCVVDACGNIGYSNGTSFATPTLAGLGICLWQALPALSNLEIIDLLKRTASRHKQPDVQQGYGIPDVYKAYKEGRKYVSSR